MAAALLFALQSLSTVAASSNDYPWSYDYDTYQGPQNWGLLFKPWMMCHNGKMQSPIDIPPGRLLFDPNLKPIHIDRISVMSEMLNTGQMPRIRIGNSARRPSANLTGGPLHGYKYRIQRIDIHIGREELNGSEHTIDGRRFPMELQMLAYNTDLYRNFSSAFRSPHGIAGISVLVDYGKETNEELLKLTIATASIIYKGQRVELADLEPWRLLPYTRDLVTYEGSMTAPGCHETVTWIILNQPIHITKDHMAEWAKMVQTAQKSDDPQFLAPNRRAVQEFNSRLVRTNIQHLIKEKKECKMAIPKVMYKSVNGPPPSVTSTKHRVRHAHPPNNHEEDFL
nr:Carbonic anhydrase domain containing protein [Haemonchus contortus]